MDKQQQRQQQQQQQQHSEVSLQVSIHDVLL